MRIGLLRAGRKLCGKVFGSGGAGWVGDFVEVIEGGSDVSI